MASFFNSISKNILLHWPLVIHPKFRLMKNAHLGFLLVTFISYIVLYTVIALIS
jgi:hypothetical protein